MGLGPVALSRTDPSLCGDTLMTEAICMVVFTAVFCVACYIIYQSTKLD